MISVHGTTAERLAQVAMVEVAKRNDASVRLTVTAATRDPNLRQNLLQHRFARTPLPFRDPLLQLEWEADEKLRAPLRINERATTVAHLACDEGETTKSGRAAIALFVASFRAIAAQLDELLDEDAYVNVLDAEGQLVGRWALQLEEEA